jgi:DNA-binding FadR family transcriptional regulator
MSQSSVRRPQFDAQEEIKKVILERGLRPGAAIPPETELMAALGISRGSLREALKGLQARGIIEVQHGRGTFVAQPSLDPLVDALTFRGRLDHRDADLTTASELVDVRDILETALVQQVACSADATLLADLEQTVSEMEAAAGRGEPFTDLDRRFHEQLYSSLGNSIVLQLVRAFWDVLDAVRPQLASGTSDPVADVAHHRVIVERIREGDPEGARQAMTEHFRATHVWIQGRRDSASGER